MLIGNGESKRCSKMSASSFPEAVEAQARNFGGAVLKSRRHHHSMLLDKELPHTAEIVLVLAGMAQMRAGQPPGIQERHLATTAFRHLVSLVASSRPQELLSKQSVETLVQELGLREHSTSEQGCSKPQGAQGAADAGCSYPEYLDPASSDGPHVYRVEDGSFPTSTSSAGPAVEAGNKLLELVASDRDPEPAILPFYHEYDSPEAYRKQLKRGAQQCMAPKLSCVSRQSPRVLPSAYVNLPMACQMCHIVTRDTATVLVCDCCELAYHVRCLQRFKARGLSDGDWDCPRCVVKHGGRPQAPVYGPLPI